MSTWSGWKSQESQVPKEAYSAGDPMEGSQRVKVDPSWLALPNSQRSGAGLLFRTDLYSQCINWLTTYNTAIRMVDIFEEYDSRPKSYTHALSGQTIGNDKVLPGRPHVEKLPSLYQTCITVFWREMQVRIRSALGQACSELHLYIPKWALSFRGLLIGGRGWGSRLHFDWVPFYL